MPYTKKFTEEINKRDMWNVVSQNYEQNSIVAYHLRKAYIFGILMQLRSDFGKYKILTFNEGFQEKTIDVRHKKIPNFLLQLDINSTPYGDMVEKIKQYLKDNNVLK